MHYLNLIKAHELYNECEERGYFYDVYIRVRNGEEWNSGKISIEEIEKLFHFIREWEHHFQGDPMVFKKVYDANYPVIRSLMKESIEDADLEALRQRIRQIFDVVAGCVRPLRTRRYESTDTSIILHTLLPRLFVIWDNNIKEGVGVYSRGANYSGVFLPRMQNELKEAIKTCMFDKKRGRGDAVAFIESQCENKTLAKLVDEYNYMKYVRKDPGFL